MTVTFLGTGTSQGVPIIACDCHTCISTDIRDHRLRSSVLLSIRGKNILIDAGPDFRQQMLTNNVKHLDAILLTHEHNDHVIGLDDIRPFNFKQRMDMPIFGLKRVLDDVKQKFSYIFEDNPYPGAPKVVCHPIEANQSFVVASETIYSIPIMHGPLPILGFRIGHFAYITDASFIHEDDISQLSNLDVLVINALQYRPHYSHFTFDEAVSIAQKIGAKSTYFTHISHELGRYDEILDKLPSNIFPAYDSLVIDIE